MGTEPRQHDIKLGALIFMCVLTLLRSSAFNGLIDWREKKVRHGEIAVRCKSLRTDHRGQRDVSLELVWKASLNLDAFLGNKMLFFLHIHHLMTLHNSTTGTGRQTTISAFVILLNSILSISWSSASSDSVCSNKCQFQFRQYNYQKFR